MSRRPTDAHGSLERIFHEPNRLAILSALCGAPNGLPFTELRDACSLTDGNLNRHLKALQEEKVVEVTKAFVDLKPRTTVTLTENGLQRFSAYLQALKDVLQEAQKALPGLSGRSGHPAAAPLRGRA